MSGARAASPVCRARSTRWPPQRNACRRIPLQACLVAGETAAPCVHLPRRQQGLKECGVGCGRDAPQRAHQRRRQRCLHVATAAAGHCRRRSIHGQVQLLRRASQLLAPVRQRLASTSWPIGAASARLRLLRLRSAGGVVTRLTGEPASSAGLQARQAWQMCMLGSACAPTCFHTSSRQEPGNRAGRQQSWSTSLVLVCRRQHKLLAIVSCCYTAMRTCIACAMPPRVLSGRARLIPCPASYAAPCLWMPGQARWLVSCLG